MYNTLFVYGTLLKKANNNFSKYLKANSVYLGKAWFHGLLFDTGEYPGAVYIPKIKYKVHGNLFEIKNFKQVISRLDEYEETGKQFPEPNEYIRQIVPVFTEDKEKECWVYLYNWSVVGLRWIESGKYICN